MLSNKFRYALIVLHGLTLALAFLLLQKIPYTYDNEAQIISWVKVVKNVLLRWEEKPPTDDFLFVNISYQKQLIPKLDDDGFEVGNEAIIDREKLAEFFARVATTNSHSVIFTDVFLDCPTNADSLLQAEAGKVTNLWFPYHYVDTGFVKPVVKVRSALSDYQSDFGTFTKYTFVQHDTCRSVALRMYQDLTEKEYVNGPLFASMGGDAMFNSFIIDMPVRQYDIFTDDTLGYSSIHLQNFLELTDELFASLLKDRIVVVGDFLESDMHTTFYGATAGPLIHVNALHTLMQRQNRISFFFIAFLVTSTLIVSWFLFNDTSVWKPRWLERFEQSKFGWVLDYLKYATFLLILSTLSYLLFGVYLNILLMSIYFSVAENVIEFFLKRQLI